MITLKEFTKRYAGDYGVGNTPGNKGQCVGLAMLWVENLGKEHFWGDAKDLFNNAPDTQWDKIRNVPDLYPEGGDIITWDHNMGGGAGHVAVVLFSNKELDSFTVLEQNNAGNEPGVACEITTYKDWSHVIGWLKPKGYDEEDTDCVSMDEFIAMKTKMEEKDAKWEECKEGRAEDKAQYTEQIGQLTRNLSLANEQNTGLTSQLKEANLALKDSRVDVDILKGEKSALEANIEALEGGIDRLSKENKELKEKANGTLTSFSRFRALVYAIIGK